MAIGVHIAKVAIRKVNSMTGAVLNKNDVNETIKEHLQFEHQHRIIEDPEIPNSVGEPTVDDYIAAEAADNYVVNHIDQMMVITYLRTTGGGFGS